MALLKKAKPQRAAAFFTSAYKAKTLPIQFKRSALPDATRYPSVQERHVFEKALEECLRLIGLVGKFPLEFVGCVPLVPAVTGIEVVTFLRDFVKITHLSSDGKTRYAYTLSLPKELAKTAYQKLVQLIHPDQSPADGSSNANSMPTQPDSAADMASMPTEAPVDETAALDPVEPAAENIRHLEIAMGAELALVEFDKCVQPDATEALSADLQVELRRVALGGNYKIKCNKEAKPNTPIDAKVNLVWCRLGPQSRGLGFWHRADAAAAWVKYALVAETVEQIEEFANRLELAPKKAPAPEYRTDPTRPWSGGGWKQYLEEDKAIRDFVNGLAKFLKENGKNDVPSKVMTEIFQQCVDRTVGAQEIGKLTKEWALAGYLSRFKPTPAFTYYHYRLGSRARTVLEPLPVKVVAKPAPILNLVQVPAPELVPETVPVEESVSTNELPLSLADPAEKEGATMPKDEVTIDHRYSFEKVPHPVTGEVNVLRLIRLLMDQVVRQVLPNAEMEGSFARAEFSFADLVKRADLPDLVRADLTQIMQNMGLIKIQTRGVWGVLLLQTAREELITVSAYLAAREKLLEQRQKNRQKSTVRARGEKLETSTPTPLPLAAEMQPTSVPVVAPQASFEEEALAALAEAELLSEQLVEEKLKSKAAEDELSVARATIAEVQGECDKLALELTQANAKLKTAEQELAEAELRVWKVSQTNAELTAELANRPSDAAVVKQAFSERLAALKRRS